MAGDRFSWFNDSEPITSGFFVKPYLTRLGKSCPLLFLNRRESRCAAMAGAMAARHVIRMRRRPILSLSGVSLV